MLIRAHAASSSAVEELAGITDAVADVISMPTLPILCPSDHTQITACSTKISGQCPDVTLKPLQMISNKDME